ncbi:MAG TPA: flagellar hook-associated protein FlgK [Baekduia sp.]|uniref:flagellar hook-associated protein FlgK n=1 Tax=Baekduia sp. TaxID=2600305 RepID=UPI002D786DFB|nr:flagellar hook-associated protein FlgK [Baekduia sp.]HET6508839.1 flagellar hook-associated protein FlgK [Baekduia sp.]
MTIPAFSGLNTALRGVQAHQAALDVTSHNISNVNTAGYTRQQVIFGASASLLIDAGAKQDGTGAQLGQGVDVLSYRRIRESFLDLQYRAQNMAASQSQVTAQRLTTVQNLLGTNTANDLGKLLDNFWTAWDGLAANPSSQVNKDAVANAAGQLSARFKQLDSDLATSGQQATEAISDMLSDDGPIKPIATELAKLNDQINRAVQSGTEPNDLLDRRDQLLDQLSQYGQVSVTADPTLDAAGNKAYPGMIQVSFAGATTPLVSQSTVSMPTTATLGASPGGQLGGLQDVVSKIDGYRTTLSSMASSLITSVNSLATNPIFSGTGASDMTTVATGATVTATTAGGAAGDNSVAAAIAALRGGAVDQAYAGLVRSVGSDVKNATNANATATSVLASIDAQRQSVSGVSMDEEMSNLIKFQRGYQAAARALTTMDDILNTLINSTGRVGM